MPPEWVPWPSFLGALAVSPLHGIACPGTELPPAFCTAQGLSTSLARSSPFLAAWHSPLHGTAHSRAVLLCAFPAQAPACAASAQPRCSQEASVPPAPDPSSPCPLCSLSPWQALLEAVKEEASSASPSSGSQQPRPSSSILPCKFCHTLHPLPSSSFSFCVEPGWTKASSAQHKEIF